MTIYEVLTSMELAMLGNIKVTISYGPYDGMRRVALEGTVKDVKEKILAYPELMETPLDEASNIVGGGIDLFATLYKGEYCRFYYFYFNKNGIDSHYFVPDVSVKHALARIKSTFGVEPKPEKPPKNDKKVFVNADILFYS